MGFVEWLTRAWHVATRLWRSVTKTAGVLAPLAHAARIANHVYRKMYSSGDDDYSDPIGGSEDAQWRLYGT
jgi:hypothetical protein